MYVKSDFSLSVINILNKFQENIKSKFEVENDSKTHFFDSLLLIRSNEK